MLSMSHTADRVRQIFLAILLLVCIAWASGEAAQQFLRWRAQHLLGDIRSLSVNRSTWSDAQPFMKKWSRSSVKKTACTAETCTYQVDLLQTLPAFLVGSPNPGAKNWLARAVDHIGLRSAAARAGFTIDHGVVAAKWFGEQVTLPVRDWDSPDGYIPYLSVASTETSQFREHARNQTLLHPNRLAQHVKTYADIAYSPEEEPSEQSALMDFRLNCITQLHPCETEGEILPEAGHMVEEQKLTLPSR